MYIMETKVVRFNDFVDIYVYDEKCLIKHEKFRVVCNNDAVKRVLWERLLF